MRFSLPSLVSLFSLACSTSEAVTTKADFMQAMRSANIGNDKKLRKKKLFSSILSSAKRVPSDRQLQYYDDAANNGDDGDDGYDGYGFDIASYSLKYAACSAIASYSDDMAADEDAETVFQTDQYVVFRLCPSDSCSNKSNTGCMDSYGEYMVPIATWLEIMSQYREEELERYCDYCAACVGDDDGNNNNANEYYNNNANAYYNNNANAYYNNRQLAYGYDDGANNGDDNAGDDKAGDDKAGDDKAGDDKAGDDGYHNCQYASECSGYSDVCNYYNKIDYTQFFECKEFDADDDNVLYIGPHCASDKISIVLGVYSDQYCSQYVGEKYDLQTLSGMAISSDALLEYYNTDCIACKESDLPFQKTYDDEEDEDDISEVCENLYGYAAKCNRHIGSANSSSYQSDQQEDNEYAVCSFIASVVTGTYDEYGYIYVDPLSFEADNKYNQYSSVAVRKDVVTADQILGLLLFSLVIVGMIIHAAILHKRITTTSAFVAQAKEPLPVNMERENSGIMMARSTTVDSSNYKAPDNPGQLA